MREIKFRYYDPLIKCMLIPSAVGGAIETFFKLVAVRLTT